MDKAYIMVNEYASGFIDRIECECGEAFDMSPSGKPPFDAFEEHVIQEHLKPTKNALVLER